LWVGFVLFIPTLLLVELIVIASKILLKFAWNIHQGVSHVGVEDGNDMAYTTNHHVIMIRDRI
jgi:hypothetical protein